MSQWTWLLAPTLSTVVLLVASWFLRQPGKKNAKNPGETDYLADQFVPGFSTAVAALRAVSKKDLGKLSTQQQLELYALYKLGTTGCAPNFPAPSAIDITARAKYDAWVRAAKAGQRAAGVDGPAGVAAWAGENYVRLMDEKFPNWRNVRDAKPVAPKPKKKLFEDDDVTEDDSDEDGDGMGGNYLASRPVMEEQTEPRKQKPSEYDVMLFAKENDVEAFRKAVKGSLDKKLLLLKNSFGENLLHIAADSGHLEFLNAWVEEMNQSSSQDEIEKVVNSVEVDAGQTPLHYASAQGHTALVRRLLELGADAKLKDMDGLTPKELANTDAIRKQFD